MIRLTEVTPAHRWLPHLWRRNADSHERPGGIGSVSNADEFGALPAFSNDHNVQLRTCELAILTML
jgi:hypothetical protein